MLRREEFTYAEASVKDREKRRAREVEFGEIARFCMAREAFTFGLGAC